MHYTFWAIGATEFTRIDKRQGKHVTWNERVWHWFVVILPGKNTKTDEFRD